MCIIGGGKMDMDFGKRQNRKVTIFACLLSVISIGLLIFGFSLVSSDKVVMLQGISNLFSKFDPLFEDSSSLLNKISTSSDIGIKSNVKISSNDTDANISFDYLENNSDKKSKLVLDVTLDDENILGADLALSDDNLYFFIDNITPNYYYTAFEYYSFLSNLSSNDYDKALALLKESITDYIDNSKDKKVNKLTYEITNKAIKDIAGNFIDSIKNDKTLLEDISSYLNISNEETINLLDEFIDSLDYEEIETVLYYRVYYYGFNQIVAYELEDIEDKISIEYKIDNKEIINVYSDNMNVFSLEITKNKKEYDFDGFIVVDDEKYNFSGKENDNTITIILDQDEISYMVVITTSEQEQGDYYYSNTDIKISVIVDSEEESTLTINIETEYYFNQKVELDLSNSVDINEISEEDLNTIYENIMNHPIYELIMGLYGVSEFSL
jgi:hypothetical protein